MSPVIDLEAKTVVGVVLKRIISVLQGNYLREDHYNFFRQSKVNLLR